MQTTDNYDKEIRKMAIRMNTMIVLIIVMILGIFWVFNFHIYIKIGATIIMFISLYYQLMAYHNGLLSMNDIGMKVQERLVNEMGYQVTKRGYKILFKYVKSGSDYKVKLKESNMPRWKLKIIKYISIFHVLLKPAWCYREYDEEDDINDVLNESWKM